MMMVSRPYYPSPCRRTLVQTSGVVWKEREKMKAIMTTLSSLEGARTRAEVRALSQKA